MKPKALALTILLMPLSQEAMAAVTRMHETTTTQSVPDECAILTQACQEDRNKAVGLPQDASIKDQETVFGACKESCGEAVKACAGKGQGLSDSPNANSLYCRQMLKENAEK